MRLHYAEAPEYGYYAEAPEIRLLRGSARLRLLRRSRPNTATTPRRPSTATTPRRPSTATTRSARVRLLRGSARVRLLRAKRPSTATTPKRRSTATTAKRPSTATTPRRPSTATTPRRPSTATTPRRPSTATTPRRPTTATTPRRPSTATTAKPPEYGYAEAPEYGYAEAPDYGWWGEAEPGLRGTGSGRVRRARSTRSPATAKRPSPQAAAPGSWGQVPEMVGYGPMGEDPAIGYYGEPDLAGYVRAVRNAAVQRRMPDADQHCRRIRRGGRLEGYIKPRAREPEVRLVHRAAGPDADRAGDFQAALVAASAAGGSCHGCRAEHQGKSTPPDLRLRSTSSRASSLRERRELEHAQVLRQRPGQDEARDQPAVGLAPAALQHVRGARAARRHQRSAARLRAREGRSTRRRSITVTTSWRHRSTDSAGVRRQRGCRLIDADASGHRGYRATARRPVELLRQADAIGRQVGRSRSRRRGRDAEDDNGRRSCTQTTISAVDRGRRHDRRVIRSEERHSRRFIDDLRTRRRRRTEQIDCRTTAPARSSASSSTTP